METAIFRINYKSDFILTLESDAGWLTPFCIKFWTGAPSQAYFAGYDGETYTHCAPVDGEPTKLVVQFDDHHLPIGDLKFQIGYHFTVADFPTSVEDEVLNQASVIIEVNDAPAQVMLDLNGETAPEIEFSLPAYANEAQRIANEEDRIAAEQQRIANEESRIAAEETRQRNEQQRIEQETARVNEFTTLKSQSQAATRNANDAATLANQKAQLAADKAALADAAATLAIQKAQLAADKAALANDAAQLANEKAALAQQKAEYAQQQGGYAKDQGDYAKDQGDYAKAQGDIAQSDHERAETDHGIAADDHTQAGNDHTRAEADHGIAANDHTQAGNDHTRAESDHGIAANDHTQAGNDHTRAESDHGIAADDHTQAGNDHTRAESDHTRAESDHAAVEAYVDSLGAFDISAYHATGGVLAKYADLTAALGTNGANIPEALRKGGMSVKFVLSSDNKYKRFNLIADEFTTDVTQWQGVDKELVAGSHNLPESVAVANEIGLIEPNFKAGTINSDGTLNFTSIVNGLSDAIQAPFKIVLNSGIVFNSIWRTSSKEATTCTESVLRPSTTEFEAYDDTLYRISIKKSDGTAFAKYDNVYSLCIGGDKFKVHVIDPRPKQGSEGIVRSSGIDDAVYRLKTNIFSLIEGGYINNTGGVTDYVAGSYSDYIVVSEGEQYYLSGSNSGNLCNCWYSEKFKILSSFHHNNEIVTAPPGAKFLRVSAMTFQNMYVKFITSEPNMKDINDKVNHDYPCFVNGLTDGIAVKPTDFVAGGYIRASDGAFVEYVASYYTDFIPILPNVKYSGYILAVNQTTIASLCQYDADKKFIASTAVLATGWFTVTMNANAKYVRCSSRQEETYRGRACLQLDRAINSIYQPVIPKLYPKANLPVIAFSFDSTDIKDQQIVALFDSYKVRCNFAIRWNYADSRMSYYGALQKRGYDICAHGGEKFTEDEGWTPATAGARFIEMKTTLENAGFQISGLIAPRSVMDAVFVPECEKVFAYCFAGASANTRQTNPCTLSRHNMETNCKAEIKAYIDNCVSNDLICVLYGHSENFGNTYTGEYGGELWSEEWNVAKIEEILQYAIAKRDARQAYLDSLDNCVKYFFDL